MKKHRTCPWWLGYFLASPIRRWIDDSVEPIISFVSEGMTVLEPGPGMGFYTLDLARRVGPSGRVIAVDIQPRMLAGLERRAKNAGLSERIETRQGTADSMQIADLTGRVDFALVCAVTHEVEKPAQFLAEISAALKPGGRMLLVEPKGHVSESDFEEELRSAGAAGLSVGERPVFRRSHAAVLEKIGATQAMGRSRE